MGSRRPLVGRRLLVGRGPGGPVVPFLCRNAPVGLSTDPFELAIAQADRTGEETRVSPGATLGRQREPHVKHTSRGDRYELDGNVDQSCVGRPDRTSGGLRRRRRRREAALRRDRRRAAGRPAARLPGVLVRLAAADRAAGGGRLPCGRARSARLQPVVEARRRRRLTPPDKLAGDVRDLICELGAESALLVGHDWGGTAAWMLR